MEIKNYTQESCEIITIEGSLDSNSVADAEAKIMPLINPNACIILDMSKCKYVSSAGLRLLLMAMKQLASKDGFLTLAGVCEEVSDVMEMTGFCCFFKSCKDVPEAIKKAKEPKKC
jgi:anti-anti-sigma factor